MIYSKTNFWKQGEIGSRIYMISFLQKLGLLFLLLPLKELTENRDAAITIATVME